MDFAIFVPGFGAVAMTARGEERATDRHTVKVWKTRRGAVNALEGIRSGRSHGEAHAAKLARAFVADVDTVWLAHVREVEEAGRVHALAKRLAADVQSAERAVRIAPFNLNGETITPEVAAAALAKARAALIEGLRDPRIAAELNFTGVIPDA